MLFAAGDISLVSVFELRLVRHSFWLTVGTLDRLSAIFAFGVFAHKASRSLYRPRWSRQTICPGRHGPYFRLFWVLRVFVVFFVGCRHWLPSGKCHHASYIRAPTTPYSHTFSSDIAQASNLRLASAFTRGIKRFVYWDVFTCHSCTASFCFPYFMPFFLPAGFWALATGFT